MGTLSSFGSIDEKKIFQGINLISHINICDLYAEQHNYKEENHSYRPPFYDPSRCTSVSCPCFDPHISTMGEKSSNWLYCPSEKNKEKMVIPLWFLSSTWPMQAKVPNCQAWSPPAIAWMPWLLLIDYRPTAHPCQELVQVLCPEGKGCMKTMHTRSWRLCLLFDFILIWLHLKKTYFYFLVVVY